MLKMTPDSEIWTRGVEDIITKTELKKLLDSGRRLRVKHGIDATGPLHIGHAAALWKLRILQEAGHKAVILLGDTTTSIGDPTGRSKSRPVLAASVVSKNLKLIAGQLKKILLTNPRVFELRRNSEWYARMPLPKFLPLLAKVTHARLVERDMFQERIQSGGEIFVNELIYPILQGYDSVMLRADVTIIGSDQLFNEHMGRLLQERFSQPPQVLVALKILPGLGGGEKMSKSLGNFIGLADSPRDKFGKAMRIADVQVIPYLESYTDVSLEEIGRMEKELRSGRDFMSTKIFLAKALVRRYHGVTAADREEKRFRSIFSSKNIFPKDLPNKHLPHGPREIIRLLIDSGLVFSRSEARRLIKQRAVEVDGRVLEDVAAIVAVGAGTTLRVGKNRFLRVA